MTKRFAPVSMEDHLFKKGSYECKCNWPLDCYVQGGDSGMVCDFGTFEKSLESNDPLTSVAKSIDYVTAFFEAFPKNPKTFIRGEGKTIEEAEKNAFDQYKKYIECSNHEFERRGYKNGAGFCKHCDMFVSGVFEESYTPEEKEKQAETLNKLFGLG